MVRKARPEESPIWLKLQNRTPRGNGTKGTKHWLNHEDRLYILWGWSQGWTRARIAEGVPCSPVTVRNVQVDLIEDLDLLFNLPIMLQVGPRQYQCQFCCEIRSARVKSMRHILTHFWPMGWAKNAPVERVEFL